MQNIVDRTWKQQKISVVIPMWNKAPYVVRALLSVLNQSIKVHEIIVVDDGSTDGGHMQVEKVGATGIRIIRQVNQGPSSARNRGIDEATGDYLAFLDADDEWYPHHIKTITHLIETFPGAGAYATAYEIHEAGGRVERCNYAGIPAIEWEGVLENYFQSGTHGAPPVCSSTVCVPRGVFEAIGGLNVGAGLGQDLEMWGRIALEYPIVFSTTVGAKYFRDVENSAVRARRADPMPPFVVTAERMIATGAVKAEILPDLIRYLDRLRIDSASRNVKIGCYPEAAHVLAGTKTDFRWKRRIVLKFYARFPLLYRFAQFVKKSVRNV